MTQRIALVFLAVVTLALCGLMVALMVAMAVALPQ